MVPVQRRSDARRLTRRLLDAADRSNDGRVSFEEFGDVVRQHPELLKLISKSEKQWILAPEGLFARPEERRGRWERFQRFLDNRLRLVVVIAIWAIVTGILGIVAAIELRKVIRNEWFLILAGAALILMGVTLIARPGAGALAVVWLIGFFAIAHGVLLIAMSFEVRGLGVRVVRSFYCRPGQELAAVFGVFGQN